MGIDGWKMAQQSWDAFLNMLNTLIPIFMPDGTKIGAILFFIIIGVIGSVFSGKKIYNWGQRFFRDLTN